MFRDLFVIAADVAPQDFNVATSLGLSPPDILRELAENFGLVRHQIHNHVTLLVVDV